MRTRAELRAWHHRAIMEAEKAKCLSASQAADYWQAKEKEWREVAEVRALHIKWAQERQGL